MPLLSQRVPMLLTRRSLRCGSLVSLSSFGGASCSISSSARVITPQRRNLQPQFFRQRRDRCNAVTAPECFARPSAPHRRRMSHAVTAVAAEEQAAAVNAPGNPFERLGVDGRLAVSRNCPAQDDPHACRCRHATPISRWRLPSPSSACFTLGAAQYILNMSAQAELRRQDIIEPTPVQAAAIPKVLQGGNVAVQCYTGSGKVRLCSFYSARSCMPEQRHCRPILRSPRLNAHVLAWALSPNRQCPGM